MEFPYLNPEQKYGIGVYLLPILLKLNVRECIRIPPSSFMAEMKLSTEERLEKLKHLKPIKTDITLKTFDVTPDIVIFQNFKPGTIYTVPLNLRNIQNVSKPLRVVFEPSLYFSVSYASESIPTHIAPGISLCLNVKFCAESVKDYRFKINFETDGETFIVPVVAIGPRPLLNLPDRVILPNTAVKVKAERTVLIQNFGQIEANFALRTTKPFSVNPVKGILPPNQSMNLTISYEPQYLGEVKDYLIVTYESGEKLYIKLEGCASTSDVRLEKGSIQFVSTSIGLTRQRSITFYNNSKHITKFCWKLYSSQAEDEAQETKLKNSMMIIKTNETIKSNHLQTYNVIDEDSNAVIYDRIYEDEIREFENTDQFLFRDANFRIIPVQGEVWPGGTLDFTIIFTPEEVKPYTTYAFLEVSGREERIQLRLNGTGQGPEVELSLVYLNGNKIYMGAVHQYSIAVVNKGDIPGTVQYNVNVPDFGGVILCWPSFVSLGPGKHGVFTVQFSSKQPGKFIEEILFKIKESDKILRFVFEGEVVCPLLSFNVSNLDFGIVSLGFPKKKKFKLNNPSVVPIEFVLKVENDGYKNNISCREYSKMVDRVGPYKNSKEFTCFPNTGYVAANSSLDIEMTLTANNIRSCTTNLVANLWGTDKHSVSIPVRYTGQLPRILCSPSEVNIRFCFVTYPYNRRIVLHNQTALFGFFEIYVPELNHGNIQEIDCISSVQEGFIKPYSDCELNLTITTNHLGEASLPIYIKLFGDQPKACCTIICNGQGPVVTVQPENLDFGKVTLLEETERFLTISNDSPIQASVRIKIPVKSAFKLEPKGFDLQPEESIDVRVWVYLCNPVKVQDKLEIYVEKGNFIVCELKARGVGTSILCEPKLHPEFNIGTHFTHQKITIPIRFTNKGFKPHKILWSRNKHLRQLKEKSEFIVPSIFQIIPNEFELNFQNSIEGCIEGFSKRPGIIEEDFYCHAVIGKENKQHIIISVILMGQFVEPLLKMSKQQMHFRQDVAQENTTEFLIDDLTITNKSRLLLQMDVYLLPPFYILSGLNLERKNFEYIELNDEENRCVVIEFDPACEDKRCFSVKETLKFDYKSHPNVDSVQLFGEVNYPTVEICPNLIEFQCIPRDIVEYREIVIQNVSPIPVTYYFEWQEHKLRIQELSHTEVCLPVHTTESKFSKASSDSGIYLKELEMRKALLAKAAAEEALELQVKFFAKKSKEKSKKSKSASTKSDSGKKSKKSGTDKKSGSAKSKKSAKSETDAVVSYLNNVMEEEEEEAPLLPVEWIFQKTITEENPSCHYIQITDELKPSILFKDVLNFSKRNQEYSLGIRAILQGVIARFQDSTNDIEVIKTLPREKVQAKAIDAILNLIPARGFLKPFECQIISVCFHPYPNVSLDAEVVCNIAGGAVNTLNITGKCSDLMYSIDETLVDFGRRVFCQVCEKTIKLSNTGHMVFAYVASANETSSPIPSELVLEAGYLTVTPSCGQITPGSAIDLLIQYFPGIAGEFNETFTLEIGYLPPVTITVHGYGVFPQIYLYLPRPSFYDISPFVSYLAIASLTPDYLKSLHNVKHTLNYCKPIQYDEDIPKVARQNLRNDGWAIISYNNMYPSVMDIDLAIERMILYQYLFDNPSVLFEHIKFHKALSVPRFYIPPYVVDFGYVVMDTVAHYTVLIFNYGPVNADIKLISVGGRKSPFEKAGLAVQFKRMCLPIGETTELFVIFHPIPDMYPKMEEDCEILLSFYLDVSHGARIPINVKAIVTVPKITSITNCLDFQNVHCGDCLKRSLFIHNNGHIDSEWSAVIKKQEKRLNRRYSIEQYRKKPVFFLRTFNGILPPGASYFLDVYFQPQFDGPVEWLLVITIDQSPNEVAVVLKGFGLKPALKINETEVEFAAALPHCRKCEQFFEIENVASFSIEVFFADFDKTVDEEEHIVNLLADFCELTDLYIPPRYAGQGLPQSFLDFYENLLDSLRQKLIKEEQKKLKLCLEAATLDSLRLSRENSSKRRSSIRSRSKASSLKLGSSRSEIPDPIALKTPAELKELLTDYLNEYINEKKLTETESTTKPDPVTAAVIQAREASISKDPDEMREGVFIIFHGGPTTNVNEVANRAGLEIGLPVYSIDQLYLESLANNESFACMKVNELINKAFKEVASEIDFLQQEGTDSYDEVQKKVDLLLSGKDKKAKKTSRKDEKSLKKSSSKKSSSKKSSKKDSKKASSKSSKGDKRKKDKRPTLIGIPEELLCEMLKQRFSLFKTGVVIESLISIFLRQPLIALNNLLKAIGNVQYIHCIILSYTYPENLIYEQNLRTLEEKRVLEEREALILRVLEMDGEAFAKLPPDDFAIFKEYVLKQRKTNSLTKREALKRRLLEIKLGIKATKAKKSMEGKLKKPNKDKKGRKESVTTKASSTKKSKTSKEGSPKKDKEAAGKKSKSSKSSKSGKKGSKKSKAKLNPEEAEKKQEFNSFENDVQVILNLMEHWDRKNSVCLKPLPTAKGPKKGKNNSPKKSSRDSKKTKAPSKLSLVQPSTPIPMTSEQEQKLHQIGIPCWLLCNAHKDKPVEAIVTNYLRHTPELQKATETLEESLHEKLEEVIEHYTVLHKTTQDRIKNISDIFTVKDAEIPSPVIPFNMSKIIKKESRESIVSHKSRTSSKYSNKSRTRKRKLSKESKKGKSRSFITLVSPRRSILHSERISERSSLEIEEKFTPRFVLNPGEKVRYKINFNPLQCGEYEHVFTVETVGWPAKYFLKCKAVCDIPRINTTPSVMFPKVAQNRTPKNMYLNNIFLTDLNLFNFGPKLCTHSYGGEQRLLAIETNFNIKNCSLLPCETIFSILTPTETYECDTEPITIEKNSNQQLTITANPKTFYTEENQLLISIKNNPRIEATVLTCQGCSLDFRITPKTIEFNRTLINRKESRSVVFVNETPVPVCWEFFEPEKVLERYNISKLMGRVDAKSHVEVVFEYLSNVPEDVPKQELKLNVYDKDYKSVFPLYTDRIEISAESIEVAIECLKEIRLGEIKAQFQHAISYTILSKGKYPVVFTLTEVTKDHDALFEKHKNIRSYFNITPLTGTLQMNKTVTLKITFLAKRAVDFREVPIILCTFTDPLNQTEIESFPLKVSTRTFASKFEICPPNEINFGYQLVGSEREQELILKNEGRFEFSYTILSLRKLLEQKDKGKKGKKGKKGQKGKESKASKSKSSKSKSKSSKKGSKKSKKDVKSSKTSKKSNKSSRDDKKKKPKPTKLDAGIFSVISSTGIIEPNEAEIIRIFSKPRQAGTFEETLVFFVSQTSGADRKGRYVRLTVEGTTPSLNLNNCADIFREQHIVSTWEDFQESNKVGCVFIKDEERLHFGRVMINTEEQTRIRLENFGPISANVLVKVSSSAEEVFMVYPEKINVEAYSGSYTTIFFRPNRIGDCQGTLTINYDSPAGFSASKLQVKLSGESLVPEVTLQQPPFDNSVGCYQINFPPTFLGTSVSETIVFENVGIIPCQVIIDISGSSEAFKMMPDTETKPLLKVYEQEIQSTSHTNLIFLQPRQKGCFQLQFKPMIEDNVNCVVKLHIVNNPFETIMIFVTAEGYTEDIIITGLSTNSIKRSNSSREQLYFINPAYELDFGLPYVNSLQKKCFRITNHSSDSIYKFVFAHHEKVMFIPAVGHLKPKTYKEMIATFLSKEPFSITKDAIECVIFKIEYLEPDLEPLSWDERQNIIVWDPMTEFNLSSIRRRTSERSNISEVSKKSKESLVSAQMKIDKMLPPSDTSVRTIKEKTEPAVHILSETSKCIVILLSVTCDYAFYECNDLEIELPDTLAFQRKSYNFQLTNMSNVFLKIDWKISMDEQYPKRLTSASPNNSSTLLKHNNSRIIQSACQFGTKIYTTTKIDRPVHLSKSKRFISSASLSAKSSKSSLFSSGTNLSNRSSDSWCEQDFLPFFIHPEKTSIPPKQSQKFTIEFTPKDAFAYVVYLRSDIPNLNPQAKALEISVKAKSLLPLYHFDITSSDYLAVRRKGRNLCKEITDENTKVVKFNAIGLGITHTKSFNIINPTKDDFAYEWDKSELNGNDVCLFHCHNPGGFIERGKTAEAMFSFLPQAVGTFEAFYTFHITKYNLSTEFLLVGIAKEPDVFFTKPHIEMKPTIFGLDVAETIVLQNQEEFELEFKFKKESLYSEARLQVLQIDPLKGVLESNSEQKIQIKFHPVKEGEVNFNLKCEIQKMKQPLTMSVTASCFEIQSLVCYETFDGERIVLDPNQVHVLDLKQMIPNVEQSIPFTIQNAGAIGFYYEWAVTEDLVCNRIKLFFEDKKGYLPIKAQAVSTMKITPLTKVVVKKLKVRLQLRYGLTYIIHLTGSALNLLYSFSMNECNFGSCLVQNGTTSYYQKTIEFINNDNIPVTLECKPLKLDFLSVNFKSKQIIQKKTEPILFTFFPREVKRYYTEIEFFINSMPHILKIYGEGVLASISLNDPTDKFIDLGCIPIGKTNCKFIDVVNNSVTPVEISFELYDRLPYFSRPVEVLEPEFEIEEKPPPLKTAKITKTKKVKKGMKEKKGSKRSKSTKSSKKSKSSKSSKKNSNKSKSSKKSKGSKKSQSSKSSKKPKTPKVEQPPVETPEMKERRLIREFITFTPKKTVRLLPQQSTKVAIKFSPNERMKLFHEKVYYQIQDNVEILCHFKGCALGPEFLLDKTFMAFGSVIQNCISKQKVVLYNIGDIGSSFKWSIQKKLNSDFVITPKEGYLSSNTAATFTVTFKPVHISCISQVKARCFIDCLKKPLELSLSGSCFLLPAPKDTIKFTCPVRQTDKKLIKIENSSVDLWTVTSAVNGSYFDAQKSFTIQPKTTQTYEITYKPLTMSLEKKHEATIFFSLPEGQGLLYNLIGIANPPLAVEKITREIRCKTYHTETLCVKNWLKVSQKFMVISDQTTVQNPSNKVLYKLTGNDVIEVLSLGQRDYTWTIFALNEGVLNFNVIFKNIAGEYLFYEIGLTIKNYPTLETIRLTSCVRVAVRHILKLQNYIKTPVEFTVQSSCMELSFEKSLTIPPYTEKATEIRYYPVTVGTTQVQLDVKTKELGSFLYQFILTGHSPAPEPAICFATTLGQTALQTSSLNNPTNTKPDFKIEFKNPELFSSSKSISVVEANVEFEVLFEPYQLGTTKSSLTLSSPTTGPFIFPLIGTCSPPRPQGPIFVKPGQSTNITYKNPFKNELWFNFAIEPAIFSLKNNSEQLKSKKETKIVISLLPLKNLEILLNQNYPITGKLTVYCNESSLSHIKWIFYLQGDL